jgi:squalene-hopene/tetraprenyl-beta-curcumene cyclase
MLRILASAGLMLLIPISADCQQATKPEHKIEPALAKLAGESIDKAIAYYRTQQGPDGSFAPKAASEMGITAIAVSSMLETKRITTTDPMIAKAMAFMEKHVQPDGGIYPKGADAQLNYLTSVGLIAFVAADKDGRYKSVRDGAIKFLKGMQWSEEAKGINKVDADDVRYGGFGYDSKKRPDLSNSSFTLEALTKAGLSKEDPAVQRAMVFLRRCQNYTGEGGNDKAHGNTDDMDGGFFYSPFESKSPAGNSPTGGLRSYASMTYAGLKSFVYAGLSKDDPRVKAAMTWIAKHYDLNQNPGMGQAGLYYYYQVFSKALKAAGVDHLTVDNGPARDWRTDVVKQIVSRQQPDGSWVNTEKRWLENDARLVTAYSLSAMAAAMK